MSSRSRCSSAGAGEGGRRLPPMKHCDPSALAEAPAPQQLVAARQTREISNGENRRMVRARFDQAQTTDENRAHWAMADSLSVDGGSTFGIRRILRMRCRYEYHNNPMFAGACGRLGRFVIGTGPRLHLGTKNKKLNAFVESGFNGWAKKIGLARKFRTRRSARFYNGESLLVMRTNPNLDHTVKLDLVEVEVDRLTSPMFSAYPANYPNQCFDGVVLDRYGNPETYIILRQHPGAFGAFLGMGDEVDKVPARYVLHNYSRVRVGIGRLSAHHHRVHRVRWL